MNHFRELKHKYSNFIPAVKKALSHFVFNESQRASLSLTMGYFVLLVSDYMQN